MSAACREAPAPAPPPKPIVAAPPAQVAPSIQAFAGCYEAEWTPANPFSTHFGNALKPPMKFVLTSAPVEAGAKEFALEGADGWNATFTSWERVDDSHVRLTWGTGFVGITVLLSRGADGSLEGVANTFSDVPEKPATARVRARRIDCGR